MIKMAKIINVLSSGATIEGDSSSGGGIEDTVENFDAAMRGATGGTAESSTEGSSGGGFADSVENFDAAMRGKVILHHIWSSQSKI